MRVHLSVRSVRTEPAAAAAAAAANEWRRRPRRIPNIEYDDEAKRCNEGHHWEELEDVSWGRRQGASHVSETAPSSLLAHSAFAFSAAAEDEGVKDAAGIISRRDSI
ncbi:unnamed protein product [Merluccius merluccius]